MENLAFVSILGIMFGIAFFVVEYYEKKLFKLHASLIAGISLAYFFLLVLPEVASGMPEYPFHLEMFEYLFILIGFVFIHVSEKLILQKVEAKSQIRVRKLSEREKNLEIVEKNLETVINKELMNEELDDLALKEVAQVIGGLNEQSDEIKAKIAKTKLKILKHINKDLNELRLFTDFFYHLVIGIILIGLLTINLITGILFALFAWFRTLITNRSEAYLMFSDLDIYEKFEETTPKKFFLACATLLGVILNIIFELSFRINLEMIFILFSFISGVILYTIVREVIPEKEKGKPLYFLTGMIGFSLFVFILKIMGSAI